MTIGNTTGIVPPGSGLMVRYDLVMTVVMARVVVMAGDSDNMVIAPVKGTEKEAE